jgi:uncharacterized HhH-GPD family protein
VKTVARLRLAQVPEADDYLSRSPLALLIGMVLDQQFPIERAFASPYELAQRLGHEPDAAELAAFDPGQLAALFARPPALHRFPVAMAERVQRLARQMVDEYGGDPARLWLEAKTGQQLFDRLRTLPGFGDRKARVLVALLGKQCGVRPRGWREAAGDYGEEGVARSVADVRDAESLRALRDYKKAHKAAAN